MSNRNYNKAHVQRILRTLNQWVKKPSLDHDLSGILDEYHTILDKGGMNFTDVALFIQAFTSILEKKVDILSQEFFALSFRLCDALRRPEEEKEQEEEQNIENGEASGAQQLNVQNSPVFVAQQQTVQNNPDLSDPQRNEVEEKPPEKKKKRRSKKNQAEEDKKIIPGLPKELFSEILQSLNLSDCNINDIVQECLNKLTPTHPLYSVFAKIGDEISRTKNLITIEDISLSGKSWNILYLLENLLNKYKPISIENNETNAENQNAENGEQVNKNLDEIQNAENGEQQVNKNVDEIQNAENGEQVNKNVDEIQNAENGEQVNKNVDEIQNAENGEQQVNKNVDENGNTEKISATENENTNIVVQNQVTTATCLTDSAIGPSVNTELEISTENITAICSNTITEPQIVDEGYHDNCDVLSNIDDSDSQIETSLQASSKTKRDIRINLLRLPSDLSSPINYLKIPSQYLKRSERKYFSDAELRTMATNNCKKDIKNVEINLFRFHQNLLLKVEYFKLSEEFYEEMKKYQTHVRSRKRQINEETVCKNLVKRLKSYDLQAFESFCESQSSTGGSNPAPVPETAVPVSETGAPVPETGVPVSETADAVSETTLPVSETEVPVSEITIPISETGAPVSETNEKSSENTSADKVYLDRKSIDQRSEMSYGYPVTPDSGHFSLSHLDSENEHTDFDLENDELRRNSSRATSVMMSPQHDNVDSGFSEPSNSEPDPPSSEPEDLTLKKLKEMFPNSFSDPTRAEFLKTLVKPPEKEKETEEYRGWKTFIDNKTARDAEFNIHEYGTQILNSFPNKTKEEKIGFSSIVRGKSVGDVSKFFVSALQLANTYNVEICDERVEGEVNTEGFNLKFLSDERPEPDLENTPDLQNTPVPSESMFINSMPSTSFAHSTPFRPHNSYRFYSNKTKRRRIDFV